MENVTGNDRLRCRAYGEAKSAMHMKVIQARKDGNITIIITRGMNGSRPKVKWNVIK